MRKLICTLRQAVVPVEPQETAPVEPQETAPVEPQETAPVEPQAGAPMDPPPGKGGAEPPAESLGPVDWVISKGDRALVSCHHSGQWDSLSGLLTGLVKPRTGSLEEIGRVKVQTDSNLKKSMDLNRSITDYLHSPNAPKYVWLGNRRKVLWVLVDILGISPSMTRKPLKLESQAVRDKYWALRFMVSQAELLLGGAIFHLPDPAIHAAMALRWGDFPGALIVEERTPGASFPGVLDTRVEVDAKGLVSVRSQGRKSSRNGPELDSEEGAGDAAREEHGE